MYFFYFCSQLTCLPAPALPHAPTRGTSQPQPQPSPRCSIKVDVYSFGMVLWELWEKKRPYEDLHSRFDIMDAIRSGRRPAISEGCPPAYRSLTQRCWQAEPGRRPNFQYIVRYLKDELARVKRQRERQMSSSEGPYPYFGGAGRDATKSTDSPPGKGGYASFAGAKFAQMLPWNRTGREAAPLSTLPIVLPPPPPEYFQQHGVGAPDLDILASSPAIGSPFMWQGAHPRALGAAAGGFGASPRDSSSGAAAAGPPNQWRDKYVMKFSGWKASQPDAGLPPSALTPAFPPLSPMGGSVTTANPLSIGNTNPYPNPNPNPLSIGNTNPALGRLSSGAMAAPIPTHAASTGPGQGQGQAVRLSNNAVLLDDQNGLFNLDDAQGPGSGSYTPPTIVGDNMHMLDGSGQSSPIVRVSNSGSGSGRWSRDPDQRNPAHGSPSPSPMTRTQSRGSNSF